MPLSSDEHINKTGESLVAALKDIFGDHKGIRPAHAKGLMFTGTFTPTEDVKSLTNAPHFNSTSTPIAVRFSSSTGIPQIPDNDANANPRGFAIRFNLPEHNGRRVHTDVITHSTPYFPVRTGEEFLEFLKAIKASPPGTESPSPVEQFVGSHPATLAFIQAPKPFPASFATEAYYGVNAAKFVSADGKATYFRYRVLPDAGQSYINEDGLKEKGTEYLYEEISKRVADAPVSFSLVAQIANEDDITDDATVHWPESRKLIKLGTLKLESAVQDNAAEQKNIIYDPIPRIQGIEASSDPLLEMRAALYIISGRQRRAA